MTFNDHERESIECTIAELTARRDQIDEAVRALRALVGPAPEPPAGNVPPPAAAKKAGPGKGEWGRTPRDVEADRRVLAELLGNGSLRSGELLERSGLSRAALAKALDDPRFKKGPGKFDPWALA